MCVDIRCVLGSLFGLYDYNYSQRRDFSGPKASKSPTFCTIYNLDFSFIGTLTYSEILRIILKISKPAPFDKLNQFLKILNLMNRFLSLIV